MSRAEELEARALQSWGGAKAPDPRASTVDVGAELGLEGLEPAVAAEARALSAWGRAAAATQEAIQAERPEDQTFLERFAPAAKVAIPAGAIAGSTVGGPGGAAGGALIGAGGAAISALAEEEAEAAGMGPVGQALVGTAADVTLTGPAALRRAGRVGRAARALTGHGLLEGVPGPGTRAAERAAETVRRGAQRLKDDVDEAYDRWRDSMPGDDIGLQPGVVREAFAELIESGKWGPGGGEFGPLGKVVSTPEDHIISARDLDLIRREFGREASQAYWRNDFVRQRDALMARDIVDHLETQLAKKVGGERSLALLQDARAKRALLGEVVTDKGDRLVGKVVVSPRTRSDNAQKAFHQILTADRPVASLRQLRQAAKAGRQNVEQFDNDLKRAAISYLFGRGPGATGAGSSQKAGAVLRKMEQSEDALRSIFGQRGYEFVYDNLSAIDLSVTGGSLEPVVQAVSKTKGMKNLLTWMTLAGVGGAGASTAFPLLQSWGGKGMALGAGLGAGHMLIDAIGAHFGPIAAKNVAIRALFDPRVYKEVTRRVATKESEAAATLIMSQFAKRGVITANDFATLEGDL